MTERDELRWFKQTFGEQIAKALVGTPFSVDFLAALALQETGEVWPILRKKELSLAEIVELCVGDTIDAPGRSAFPKNKAELLRAPQGEHMFQTARAALLTMSKYVPSYASAGRNPDKFCHGYGVWQYDIQFFKTDPNYFLERKWKDLSACLSKCLGELKAAQKRVGLEGRTTLNNDEMTRVAIGYNRGSYNPARGLKQGFRDSDGVYYGERIASYLKMAQEEKVEPTLTAGEEA